MPVNISGADGELFWRAGIDVNPFVRDLQRVKDELNGVTQNVQQQGETIDDFFKKAAQAAAGYFSIQAATDFIEKIKDVRSEFQQLEASYQTILGSKQKADQLMAETAKFAATTPFSLKDVAEGTKLLLAYGLTADEVTASLKSIGDIASSIDQPINELAMVYGQIRTQGRLYTQDLNQLTGRGVPIIAELAKQFGVADDRVKDLVESGKVGFPEIEKAFQSMTTGAGMFAGAMEAQSKTLKGQISNLEDNFESVLNEIGKKSEGIFNTVLSGAADAVGGLNVLVTNYQQILNVIQELVVIYGSYKAAVLVSTAYQKVQQAATFGYIATLSNESVAKIANTQATLENMRAEVSAAAAKRASTLQVATADLQALKAATERLALAKATQAASAADIYSSTRAAEAKAVQAATEEVVASKEKAAISRKAALAASSEFYTAQQTLETTAKEASAVATLELTEVEALNAAGKKILTGVQGAYNAVLAAAPMAAYTGALAAAVTIIYALTANTDALKKSQEALNQIDQDAIKNISSQKEKLESLKKVIGETNRTEAERLTAVKTLRDVMGERLKQYKDEEILAGKAANAIAAYTEELLKSAKAAAAQTKLQDLESQLLSTDSKTYGLQDAYNAIPTRERLKMELTSFVGDMASGKNRKETQEGVLANYRKFLTDQKDGILKQYGKYIDDLNAGIKNTSEGIDEAEKKRLERFKGNLKDAVLNFDKLVKDSTSKADISAIKDAIESQINALAPGDAKIKQYQDKLKRVQEIEAQYGLSAGDKQAKSYEGELSRRKSIYERIGELSRQQLANSKSNDQKEIDSVKEKYQKILDEIAKYNSKAKVKIPQAVVQKVLGIQTAEVDTTKAKQEVEKEKTTYDELKATFDEYERYKSERGKTEADLRFANEMKGAISFTNLLQNQLEEIEGLTDAKSNAMRDMLRPLLDKSRIDDAKREVEAYRKLLDETYSFERLIRSENEKHESNLAILKGKNDTEAITQENKRHDAELQSINDSNFEKLEAYKKFYRGLDTLATDEAQKVIDNLVKELKSKGKDLSPDLLAKLKADLNSAGRSLSSRLPDALASIASSLGDAATQAGQFDNALGKTIGTASNVLQGVSQVMKAYDQIKSSQNLSGGFGQTVGGITGGLSFISSAMGIVKSIMSVFDNSAEKARQQQYSDNLRQKSIEAQNKLLERQIELTKELYGDERVVGYRKALVDIEKAQADVNRQLSGRIQLTNNEKANEYIKKYNSGEKFDMNPLKMGGFDVYNAVKNAIDNGPRLPSGLEELTRLLDQGKLDENTAALVRSLLNLEEQYKETVNAINQEIIGTSFDTMIDDMLSALQRGEDGFDAFSKSVQKSLMNSFSRKFLEKQLQPWYDKLAEFASSDGGLSKDEIDQLRTEYTAIFNKASEDLKAYQQATGVDLTGGEASNLSGAVKREITEQTGSAIEGLMRSTQTYTLKTFGLTQEQLTELKSMNIIGMKQHLEISAFWERNLQLAIKIEANTGRTADNTDRLESIENSLKSLDRKITSNSSPAGFDKGLGI